MNDIYNKVKPGNKFFTKPFILRNVIFYIEKQLFCKGTLVIWENCLFFNMFSSVPLAPRSLHIISPPRKNYSLEYKSSFRDAILK